MFLYSSVSSAEIAPESRPDGLKMEADMANRDTPPISNNDDAAPEYLFRASIRLRDGRRIYAKQCGIKAFRIPRRY